MVRASLRMLQRCVLMLLVASIAACGDDGVTAPSTETTETFSSALAVGGWASHSLSVLEPGTVTVTLDSISPAVVVGLGFGVFDGSVSSCTLMASIETAGGSTDQLVNAVESGTYCVKISDIGNLRQSASFSISISRS